MKTIRPFIGIIGAVTVWQLVAWSGIFNPIYFAGPWGVAAEACRMFGRPAIYLDIMTTLMRIGVSIIISTIIGIPLGIILGSFAHLYLYLEKTVDFLRSIPPIVVYPLLLISLGPGDSSRIGVAVFGSTVALVLIVSKSLYQQSPLRRAYFSAMGANFMQVIKDVIWYEALPHIMVALKVTTSLSIIVIVVTEMLVGAEHGLGVRIQNVQITSNIPDLFVTIIVVGWLGIGLNKIIISLDRKFVFWKT